MKAAVNSTRGLLQVLSPGIYPAPTSKQSLRFLEGLRMDLRALALDMDAPAKRLELAPPLLCRAIEGEEHE